MPEDLIEQKWGGAVRVQLVVCIWVRVRRFFLVGAACFFNVMVQKISFVLAAAWLHKVDLVMGWMQKKSSRKIPYSISIQRLDL